FPSRGIGVFGGAVYLVDYGDLDRTDINGNTIARIAPRNFEFLASYATNLTGSFVFGISYKLVQFRVDCSGDCRDFPAGTGATHALDLGGQFSVGPGRAVGDPGRTRHRLSAAGAGACRLRVRPRRTERTERGTGTRERLARRRPRAGVPHRLGPASREPDVLFLPRVILMKGQARL